MAELTPMMQQYRTVKERNPDCILFFRLGDFTLAFLSLFFGFLEVLLFATSSNAIASSKNSAVTSKIRCKTNSFSVSSRMKCMVQSPVLLLYREHR